MILYINCKSRLVTELLPLARKHRKLLYFCLYTISSRCDDTVATTKSRWLPISSFTFISSLQSRTKQPFLLPREEVDDLKELLAIHLALCDSDFTEQVPMPVQGFNGRLGLGLQAKLA